MAYVLVEDLDVAVGPDAAYDVAVGLDVAACDGVHREGHRAAGHAVDDGDHHRASSFEVHLDLDHLGHLRRILQDEAQEVHLGEVLSYQDYWVLVVLISSLTDSQTDSVPV